MKRTTAVFLFLLMMMSAAAGVCDMDYNLTSPYLTYTKTEGSAMPELLDPQDMAAAEEAAPEDAPAEAAGNDPAQDVWPKTFTVTVLGDTTLGSTDGLRQRDDSFESVYAREGAAWFMSGTRSLLDSDDMTLVNFEGTITESNDKKEKKFNFKAPAEYVDILTLGSVEAANIANNHIVDYGDAGEADTIAALQNAGIVVSGGSDHLGVFEKDGVKVGLVGHCFPYKDGKKDITKDVRALRDMGCQIVIASFHWGSEYEKDFSRDQRTIGRAAIKAGADIVVGHHPHIVQGIEAYEDTYILYSLGNFVFGGNVDPTDRDAYAARLTFTVYEDRCDAPEVTIVPLQLTELESGTDYRPVLAEGEEAERIVQRILKRSYKMEDFVNGTWE